MAFKKKLVGKEENAGNQHFLLFPQGFFFKLYFQFQPCQLNIIMSSASALNLNHYTTFFVVW